MSFYGLSDEILLIIFKHCGTKELIQLSHVCKRFRRIASEPLNEKANHLLITGQMSKKFRERCQLPLSTYTSKFSIYHNWKYGKCLTKTLFKSFPGYDYDLVIGSVKIMPWKRLQITKNTIWLCDHYSSYLCAFNRTFKDDSMSSYNNWVVKQLNFPIVDMVLYNSDVILISHFDGSIRQWMIKSTGRNKGKYFDEKVLKKRFSRNGKIAIGATSTHIISASDMGEFKIWKYIREKNAITEENILYKSNYRNISSIEFDVTKTKFAALYNDANYENHSTSHCIIYDINKGCIETNKEYMNYKFKQLLWEDPNTILLRWNSVYKVDLRIGKIVHKWNSFNHYSYNNKSSRLTCMASDNQYAIMTGTSDHEIILWDQRKDGPIQTYTALNPFVRAVQFDSSHMYCLCRDVHVTEFNFACNNIANIPI